MPFSGGAEFAPAAPVINQRWEVLAVDFDQELDTRGLTCPLPILKTKKSLNELASGQVLKIVATDPGSVKDMQAFAKQTGNALLAANEDDDTFTFYMRKK